ncbi:restriction endonuclease subunit S [Polynucleobacter asymbioticus]|uniref:restriction endonuclease subunit S n=1 Tax=Polynucleobacter asymbioticus TaxID=576611 RepID=UPI001BFD0EAE|nr:restriction endonuclease subunit S [Polynucleobacter asymbioticus]QWD84467.1 restriction endonuclease subunit S [Polynucleobacter asymbioticus]
MALHKRYPSYKSTSDAWFGEAPSHWDELPNRAFLKIHKDVVGDKSSDLDLLSLTLRGIVWRDKDSGEGKFPESFDGYQHVAIGDLVFCLFDMDETPRTVGLSQYSGMITSAYTVMRPSERAYSKYVYYYYLNHDTQKSLKPYYSGLRKVVTKDIFKSIKVSLPPYEEQVCIANFLDREISKIDELINKQEKLIALIGEQKNSLITEVLTKGLNKKTDLMGSGNRFVREIPLNWAMRPLKYCLKANRGALRTGPFGSELTAKDILDEGDIKIYNQRTVIDNDFSGGENFITREKYENLKSFEVSPGDILVTSRGTIGRASIVPKSIKKGVLHPCLIRMQIDENILLPEYLVLAMNESNLLINQLAFLSNSTTIEVIYSYTLANIVLPIPPLSEQIEILSFANKKIDEIKALKDKAICSVNLLKEHRGSLISAAVTGKIDVREMAL